VKAGEERMMWEALREAVDEEMERDPTVCMMGATPLYPNAWIGLPGRWGIIPAMSSA
jgi:hypothetical protein